MRTTKDFIKDGVMLTVTMLILRTAGVFFSARLAILAGASVMGLYTQIMSVYGFAVTASAAGVNLGAVRITSENYGGGHFSDIRCGVRESVSYCLKIGIAVSLIFYFGAPFFGGKILADGRTVSSLRALALALPFISVSNALHGYFHGVKRIYKSAAVSLIEQFVRIGATLYALTAVDVKNTEAVCLTLVICNAASEALSCFTLFILYIFDVRRFPRSYRESKTQRKRFIGITLPVAVSSLIRSGLTTSEHILIPIGLRAFGADSDTALAKYGIVSGMALPILLYPMALLSAFASVTISELSARVSAGESRKKINATVSKGVSLALIYGIGCTAIIRYFSDALGNAVYNSADAGEFLRIMAPLVIFMYLDHISDGMLKGLDKQNYVMKINIFDAALSVLFAIILIPRFGIYGFVASIYICECLNCVFSFGMLMVKTGFGISFFESLAMPAFSIIVSIWLVTVTGFIFSEIGLHFLSGSVALGIILSVIYYFIFLRLTGSLKPIKKTENNVNGNHFKREAVRPMK